MWTTRTVSAVAVGAVLSLGLVGCGSDSDSVKDGDATPTATTAETTTEAATQAAPAPPPGEQPTIASYIEENGITQVPVSRGEPGAPVVDLPTPDNWVSVGPENMPKDAYDAFIYTGPNASDSPPRIIVWYQKLTGNVDPEKILDVAGGSLRNLPGWDPMNEGQRAKLSGYEAYQLGGVWKKDGQDRLASQKTVVIPADDAVYVLQINVMGHVNQFEMVGAAIGNIESRTTITPA